MNVQAKPCSRTDTQTNSIAVDIAKDQSQLCVRLHGGPEPQQMAQLRTHNTHERYTSCIWVQMEAPKQVARRSDMDMNGHINNVTYLGWALETVPPHIADSSHLFQVGLEDEA